MADQQPTHDRDVLATLTDQAADAADALADESLRDWLDEITESLRRKVAQLDRLREIQAAHEHMLAILAHSRHVLEASRPPGPVPAELADFDAAWEWHQAGDGAWELRESFVGLERMMFGAGGVMKLRPYLDPAVRHRTMDALDDAGLITVDLVRRAAADGTLAGVKGIGPKRLAAVHAALALSHTHGEDS